MSLVFKIVPAALWREAKSAGTFNGAPVDLADGFIHFSTAAQVEETAARHFAGQDGLLIVAVPATRLGGALRWEPSRGGQLFPHLYGPLPLDCVDWVRPLPIGPDGRHVFPCLAPRWEWRAFGQRFGEAETQLTMRATEPPVESEETYLLADADTNVKLRAGRVDVKERLRIDANGIELWAPVAHHYESLEAFAGAHRPAGSSPRRVTVRKRRVRALVQGCAAELVGLDADGVRCRSIAVESEDATRVVAAVRTLGLGGYANTSYPRGLSVLLGLEPSRYAAIDVGTNSVKFHLAARDVDGHWRTLVDRAEVTRLGEGLARMQTVSEAALARTATAIVAMVEEARRLGAVAIVAVGTAGLRQATNRDEVVAAVEERTGVRIEVIPGDEESRLGYLAAQSGLGPTAGGVVVFDSGGGSSQFTFGHDATVDERFSLDVGAARYTERFGLDTAVTPEVVKQARAAIGADLARLNGRPHPAAVVGMGGAVTNLAAVSRGLAQYDPAIVGGSTLDAPEVDRQIELYRSRDAEARRAIPGLQPDRAAVILAGACIVRTIMEKLGVSILTVSDRGLRHGLLVDRFGA